MTPNNFPGPQAGNWQAFSSISVSASLHSWLQWRHRIFLPFPQDTLQADQSVHGPHFCSGLFFLSLSKRNVFISGATVVAVGSVDFFVCERFCLFKIVTYFEFQALLSC